ncbi:MAG: hypothetical protein HY701_11625 [Gemmatimonadetes bacterium]|nr:hypothetical protein [Gemmatimonadota bacterium]
MTYRSLTLALVAALGFAAPAQAKSGSGAAVHNIPAFARKYRTSCSTCHTAAPKLNVLGEAYRLNGYRFPENDVLLRRDEPVPLGEEPWKDLWPRAIWPGEIPGGVPLAVRLQNDVQFTRDPEAGYRWTYRFPEEIYLLAGSTLGDGIAAFAEAEWSRETGFRVVQAKIKFQDVVPGIPQRALNLWVGLQNLYLFTFADRQIDRAARQNFLWQTFRVADLELRDPTSGETLRSANQFQLRTTQPGIEMNGLAAGRLYYAVGVSQGAGPATVDHDNHKDLFYKVRYKLGGLGLDGLYPAGGGPMLGGHGQLLDRSLIVEHFGYFGAEAVGGGRQDRYRSFGVNARVISGPWDVGVGYVWARNENPWGPATTGEIRHSSVFGKAEVLVFPWFIASLKYDQFDADVRSLPRDRALAPASLDRARVLPGAIALVRQNVRAVVEAELFTRHAPSAAAKQRRPHNLWVRLDIAF